MVCGYNGDITMRTARPLLGQDAKKLWGEMSKDKMQISCPVCLTFHSSAFAVYYESRRTRVDKISVEIYYKKYDL
jgi:hypothetical protein